MVLRESNKYQKQQQEQGTKYTPTYACMYMEEFENESFS